MSGLFFLAQCTKDKKESTVTLTVKDVSGHTKSSVTVYMFNQSLTGVANSESVKATRTAVSDNKGLVSFPLDDLFEMTPIYRQTLLYFVVFNTNGEVIGTADILVTEGKSTQGVLILQFPVDDVSGQ